MLSYLFTFSISLLFFFIASKRRGRGHLILQLTGLFILSCFAGVRDSGVGTDTLIYVDDVWGEVVKADSFENIIRRIKNGYITVDKGYVALNYIMSLVGADVHLIYFASVLSVLLIIFWIFKIDRLNTSLNLMMFLFCFCFYNMFLSSVRQSIAVSLCACSYLYLEQKKYIQALVIWIIALQMHSTAIVFLIALIIHFVFQMKNVKIIILYNIVTLLCFYIVYLNFNNILSFVISRGLIPIHYEMYMADSEGVFQTSLLVLYTFFLLLFVYSFVCEKNGYSKQQIGNYIGIHIIGIFLSIFSVISYEVYRISLYFLFLSIIVFLPRALCRIKYANRTKYRYVLVPFIILTTFVWYYVFIFRGDFETFPYTSKIIGITE